MFENHNDANIYAFRDFVQRKLKQFPDRVEMMQNRIKEHSRIFKYDKNDGIGLTLQESESFTGYSLKEFNSQG